MSEQQESNEGQKHVVLVIGGGPAGIFLSDRLAKSDVDVLLINRDIRPGGLVEYGIYPTKFKLIGGIRRQIKKVLALPGIHYLGNVPVGSSEVVSIETLRGLGASALAFTVGAQGTNYLGIKGEKRAHVYHAKDLVYHYSDLPPFAKQEFSMGQKVLIVGMGNVSIDIAHWLVRVKKVAEVTIVARRGPAERKYTGKEVKVIAANVDREDLDAEFERVRARLEAVGQDVDAVKAEVIAELDKKPLEKTSETKVRFRYLYSPEDFLGEGEDGALEKVLLGENELYQRDDSVGCRSVDNKVEWAMDSAVFAVGDKVEDALGLPYERGRYLTGSEGVEAYQVQGQADDAPLFVAGWARNASDGLVGVAKKDGQTCGDFILETLKDKTPGKSLAEVESALKAILSTKGIRSSDLDDVAALEAAEAKVMEEKGVEGFKFDDNKTMFAAIDGERA